MKFIPVTILHETQIHARNTGFIQAEKVCMVSEHRGAHSAATEVSLDNGEKVVVQGAMADFLALLERKS